MLHRRPRLRKRTPTRSRSRKPRAASAPNPILLGSPEGNRLLARNEQALSVIITVHNEESGIRSLLESALRLNPKELIVVENGSDDRTPEICREYPIRLISYPQQLGHDIGRALGAEAANGEVLLFLDGDMEIDPASLLPFVKACYQGADVVLNDLDPLYAASANVDYVSMAKYYINRLMSRQDLGFCSLTAVPHAMKKSAASSIGFENLAVPPKAHAIALHKGLNVVKGVLINVFQINKFRSYHNEVGHMILGDHVEALHWLQEHTSSRVRFPDRHRMRSFAELPMSVQTQTQAQMRGQEQEQAQTQNRKLKIVHAMSNAPFAYPLPPLNQGGTEKVFYDLTEELVRLGHEVIVFAPEGSTCSGRVVAYPSELKEKDIGAFVSAHLPPDTDMINDFTFSSSVKLAKPPVPTVSTHQCALGSFTSSSIYPSRKMRDAVGKQIGHVVYNGIQPDEYEYEEHKQDYLLFIGRVVKEKGVLEAMDVAEKTNHKLIIAGPIKDEALFENEIKPRLRDNPDIEYVGAVGGKKKQELFKNAKCVLFPIQWEEPFGLVMIEAMAAGTPVLAFNQGSVPEVMAGFPQLICEDADDMARKVQRADFPASAALRQYVKGRFSRTAMAENYVDIYRSMLLTRTKKRIRRRRRQVKKRGKA